MGISNLTIFLCLNYFFFVSEEALTSSEVNHDTISVVNLKKKRSAKMQQDSILGYQMFFNSVMTALYPQYLL